MLTNKANALKIKQTLKDRTNIAMLTPMEKQLTRNTTLSNMFK